MNKTGYPFYTSIWEIEHLPVPQTWPYNKLRDYKKLGTEGTYSLRQLLNNLYLEVAAMNTLPTIEDEEINPYEVTIKSAKGLSNISEYLKDKGLIKIGGPKVMNEGEIDAHEEVKVDK